MSIIASPAPRWVVVAALDDLALQAVVPVRVEGHALLLVRDGARVRACQRTCPHEFADLKHGRVAGGRLFCPRHCASFGLADGACGNGWNIEPLRLYHTSVEAGRVAVDAAEVASDFASRRTALEHARRRG